MANRDRDLTSADLEDTDDGYTVGKRSFPRFVDLFRPNYIVSWLFGFAESWILSRPYGRLAAALPFLIVAIGGSTFVWWLRTAPKNAVVSQYEAAVDQASQDDDHEKVTVYLKGLIALRPKEYRYRFRLAMHQLEHGRKNQALENLVALTHGDGYTPARMWFVRQALSPEPEIALEDDAVEKQLRVILDRQPGNLEAIRMLAGLYLKNNQLQAAEARLLKVLNQLPELGLPLAKIQRQLKRDEKQIQDHLRAADAVYAERLIKTPDDVKARINRADIFVQLGRTTDAEQLLQEGLTVEDSQELRAALATLYGNIAVTHLARSPLNIEYARTLVVKAITLAPEARQPLLFALQLVRSGATYTAEDLEPALAVLRKSEDENDQLLLAEALAATAQSAEAIKIVEPLVASRPEARSTLVRLYRSAGREEEAQELLDELLAEERSSPESDAVDSLEGILRQAELLQMGSRFLECMTLLEENRPPESEQPTAEQTRWNAIYGRACLGAYDAGIEDHSFEQDMDAITLMEKAFSSKLYAPHVLERLARLENSDHELAERASETITRLLATGNADARQVYTMLGTQALDAENYQKAITYLERAYSLNQRDPQTNNNLALALIRGSDKNPERALQLADQTLEIIPNNPDALSTRAEVLMALERWDEARRDLEIAMPHRPKSQNAHELMAKVYEKLGETALAEQHSRIAAELAAATSSED